MKNFMHAVLFLVAAFCAAWWVAGQSNVSSVAGPRIPRYAAYAPRPVNSVVTRAWEPGDSKLVDLLTARGVDSTFVRSIFSNPRLSIDTAVVRILTVPRGKKASYSFLFTDSSIADGKAFLKAHRSTLDSLRIAYGISPPVIAAVVRIETDFGRFLGRHTVVNALYTMYRVSPRRRAMAVRELACFFLLAREREIDPFAVESSWAGAFGISQFMPCSLSYAVDGNGDETIDLFDLRDAMASIANYLRAHGWSSLRASQLRALRAYNRGPYAGAVMAYAEKISNAR
ncbi:MAG: lytic murein transglycosylase [Candidatus Brennerbacteria bacterium]|nr:lytic murein transglycosylase [Candidatus Brennerbacteria bacterium]